MNIKTLRRNYEQLTMLERLSLADNAEARDDENEIRAINAASPKESYRQVAFYDLKREITTFRLCNLIVRLGYIMQFDYFLMQAELDILNDKSVLEDEEGLFEDARMAAFLYVRATDSWKAVNDELGLRPNFDEETSEFILSLNLMKRKEKLMRKMAYTEMEAQTIIKKRFGDEIIQTLEDEIKATREALDLPPKN